ncbi:MAG: tetratricopeptide repeat protein [Dethiobacter sp.]|nr:tetratricopeptide repeat protein [Dethiobacter sp.]
MAKREQKHKEIPVNEVPWPKELTPGVKMGVLWGVAVFIMMLFEWKLGLAAGIGMAVFVYNQRRTPVGRARAHFIQGRAAYRKHKLQEALEQFNQALEIMPDAKAIYPVVGDINFQLVHLPQAKKAYGQYFDYERNDNQMRIWYAGKLMEQSLYKEAAQELERLPADLKQEIQQLNLLALCYLKTGKIKNALNTLERHASKESGTGEHELISRYLLARIYIEAGEKVKARRILEKLDQDRPGFEDVPGLLAMLEQEK